MWAKVGVHTHTHTHTDTCMACKDGLVQGRGGKPAAGLSNINIHTYGLQLLSRIIGLVACNFC